jgi:hypothetical protein
MARTALATNPRQAHMAYVVNTAAGRYRRGRQGVPAAVPLLMVAGPQYAHAPASSRRSKAGRPGYSVEFSVSAIPAPHAVDQLVLRRYRRRCNLGGRQRYVESQRNA